jgi:hypothetical protein
LWDEALQPSWLTLPKWGLMCDGVLLERTTPGLPMCENESGFWPTLTAQDAKNNGAPSQMERNTKPLNAEIGGPLNPAWAEWFMGWPIGFTDCAASATDKFQQWCASHGIFSMSAEVTA